MNWFGQLVGIEYNNIGWKMETNSPQVIPANVENAQQLGSKVARKNLAAFNVEIEKWTNNVIINLMMMIQMIMDKVAVKSKWYKI